MRKEASSRTRLTNIAQSLVGSRTGTHLNHTPLVSAQHNDAPPETFAWRKTCAHLLIWYDKRQTIQMPDA